MSIKLREFPCPRTHSGPSENSLDFFTSKRNVILAIHAFDIQTLWLDLSRFSWLSSEWMEKVPILNLSQFVGAGSNESIGFWRADQRKCGFWPLAFWQKSTLSVAMSWVLRLEGQLGVTIISEGHSIEWNTEEHNSIWLYWFPKFYLTINKLVEITKIGFQLK